MKDKIRALFNEYKIKGAIQDEYLDHYLTRYEQLLAEGNSPESAAEKTFSEINISELKQASTTIFYIHQKRKIQLAMILIPLLTLFTISQFNTSTEVQTIAIVDNMIMQSDSILLGKLLDGPTQVSSHFGLRKNPLVKKEQFHKGIDLKANFGDAIYSPLNGIVEKVGADTKRGNYIELSHEKGYTTRYYHLSTIDIKPDEAIRKGQKIGTVGTSGMSLAPHLHFEISKKEELQDPRLYLRV